MKRDPPSSGSGDGSLPLLLGSIAPDPVVYVGKGVKGGSHEGDKASVEPDLPTRSHVLLSSGHRGAATSGASPPKGSYRASYVAKALAADAIVAAADIAVSYTATANIAAAIFFFFGYVRIYYQKGKAQQTTKNNTRSPKATRKNENRTAPPLKYRRKASTRNINNHI